jgi:hypothetical protein
MFKEKKKKEKKSCLFWGLNPRLSVTMQLTVVLAYLSILQSGGNALGGSYLKVLPSSSAEFKRNGLLS